MRLIEDTEHGPLIFCEDCYRSYISFYPDRGTNNISNKLPYHHQCDICGGYV